MILQRPRTVDGTTDEPTTRARNPTAGLGREVTDEQDHTVARNIPPKTRARSGLDLDEAVLLHKKVSQAALQQMGRAVHIYCAQKLMSTGYFLLPKNHFYSQIEFL